MKSIDQRSYFKEMNKFNSDGLNEHYNSTDNLLKNRPMSKGFLSEYQHSYFIHPSDSKIRNISARPKDSVSFVNKSMLQDSFILENIENKHGDERGHNIKSNSASLYRDDYSYYGAENHSRENDDLPDIARLPPNIVYKKHYIKNFDEMNNGFVDTYSMTKGGALTQSRDGLRNSSSSLSRSHSKLPNIPRNHDLRSVWIPKKFEGRNMFVSHIDSMIFPDKTEKEYETGYSKNYDASSEAKRNFEKAPYDRVEKSVHYVMNYENKYVPSVRWYPPQKEFAAPHQHDKDDTFDARSIYQADFEQPIPTQTQKPLRIYSGNEIQKSLENLTKRRNEIDEIMAKN